MIDAKKVAEAEKVFVAHDKNRLELKAMLDSRVFQQAWGLLDMRRRLAEQVIETKLSSDVLVSVRLNSQRVGVDERLDDLYDLTEVPVPNNPDLAATFDPKNDNPE